MPLRLRRQDGLFMYLCYEKYGMQQAVEIGLSSRLMCRVGESQQLWAIFQFPFFLGK